MLVWRSHVAGAVYRNEDRLERYLERVEAGRSPVESVFELDAADRQTQFIVRTLGGFEPLDRAVWEQAFGAPIEADHGEALLRLCDGGLIEDDGTHLALTETGRLVYDRVVLCFYPARARDWLTAPAS